MPSLKKKRNTYYAVFKDANRTPNEKWIPLGTRLKSAATIAFNDLQRRKADPNDPFDPWTHDGEGALALSVQEGIDAFLASRSHRRPQTIKMYRSYLSQWSQRLPAGMMMRDVGPEHVRSYFWEKGLEPNALRARARHLKAFFSWAVKAGHLDENPVDKIELPRKQKKIPTYITPEDVDRVLRAIDADYEIKAGEGKARPGEITWLKDVVTFAVPTGLRRSEICSLRWEAVNLSGGLSREGLQEVRPPGSALGRRELSQPSPHLRFVAGDERGAPARSAGDHRALHHVRDGDLQSPGPWSHAGRDGQHVRRLVGRNGALSVRSLGLP